MFLKNLLDKGKGQMKGEQLTNNGLCGTFYRIVF